MSREDDLDDTHADEAGEADAPRDVGPLRDRQAAQGAAVPQLPPLSRPAQALHGRRAVKRKKKLAAVSFDTACRCSRPLTVTVTFGRPPTFTVDAGQHACAAWPDACRDIIRQAEARRQ